MNELSIPTLLRSGRKYNQLRWWFIILFLFALLLHIGLFVTLGYFGKHPLSFLFPDEKAPIKVEESLNYVLVDDDLVDEEVKDEPITAIGKTSRQSRDTTIDPELPKLGPSSTEESSFSAFQNGNPMPESIAAPELTPTPPPVPQVKPKTAVEPSKPIQEPIKPMPQPKKQELPDLPELDILDDIVGILPEIKKPEKTQEFDKFDDFKVPGINDSDEISKIEEPIEKPTEQPKPVQQAQKPVSPQRRVPTRKIPVKQIGSKSSANGGKMQTRLDSSAINAGSKSIAVLKSRYGDYMDKILRRIQQAIIIQQQINPISIHEGNVVMSFTISPQGVLEQIGFIGALPRGISTEISAARSVLSDVQNGEPFAPPTTEMLNDPDFQKIIINFVFENR